MRHAISGISPFTGIETFQLPGTSASSAEVCVYVCVCVKDAAGQTTYVMDVLFKESARAALDNWTLPGKRLGNPKLYTSISHSANSGRDTESHFPVLCGARKHLCYGYQLETGEV